MLNSQRILAKVQHRLKQHQVTAGYTFLYWLQLRFDALADEAKMLRRAHAALENLTVRFLPSYKLAPYRKNSMKQAFVGTPTYLPNKYRHGLNASTN